MATYLRKEFEGRVGASLRPVYIVYCDGAEVGSSKRKWLAQAISKAVALGHIAPTGDTTMALAQWARDNDKPLYERIVRSGE